MMGAEELSFVALGGAGEIGMNLSLYGCGGRWLMVDLGLGFADESTPGIDIVVPDPAFIVERREALDGIVLTHAHEDHLGAVATLWPRLRRPVYASPFAAAVLSRKLAEAGLKDVPVRVVEPNARFDVGPFEIEYLTAAHSIPRATCSPSARRRGLPSMRPTGSSIPRRWSAPGPTRTGCARSARRGCARSPSIRPTPWSRGAPVPRARSGTA